MKKVMMAMAAALMLQACETVYVESGKMDAGLVSESDSMQKKVIVFDVGPGSVSHEPMTRADLGSLGLTDLWLIDFIDGVKKQVIHQSGDDDGFGSLKVSLTFGRHKLAVVASRGSDPQMSEDGSTITWVKPSDTFWVSEELDVTASTAAAHPLVLRRVATRLKVQLNDEIPANASKLVITPATWYYGLTVADGSGTAAKNQARPVSIPASYIGTSGQMVCSIFGLSPSDEWQTDINLKLVDEDDTELGSATLNGATFSQNVSTVYTGYILKKNLTGQVTANDSWGDDNTGQW